MLREGDMTAGEISDRFPLAKSTLSGHFNVLRHAELIVSERTGTKIVYSLNLSAIEETVAAVLQLFHTETKPSGNSSDETNRP